jgi:hypothetical protein
MALYIPVARRRRNAALLAGAALILGLVVGLIVGRQSAVTAAETAASVRTEGDTLGTRIDALTIEYEQAVSGTGDTIQGGVLDALVRIDADLDRLIEDAVWLGSGQIGRLHDATAAVRDAAEAVVPTDDFATVTATSSATVRDIFGAGN